MQAFLGRGSNPSPRVVATGFGIFGFIALGFLADGTPASEDATHTHAPARETGIMYRDNQADERAARRWRADTAASGSLVRVRKPCARAKALCACESLVESRGW
jgi:hypothetical protein